MDNEQYLSVKEFAKRANVTVQAVYQRLDTTLKPFVKVIKGQKMLNIKALEELYGVDVEQDIQQDFKENQQDIKGTEQQLIDMLKEQLAQKDKEIDRLYDLLENQQKLNLAEKQRIYELEQKQAEMEQKAAVEEEPMQAENEPKKKWFWWK